MNKHYKFEGLISAYEATGKTVKGFHILDYGTVAVTVYSDDTFSVIDVSDDSLENVVGEVNKMMKNIILTELPDAKHYEVLTSKIHKKAIN